MLPRATKKKPAPRPEKRTPARSPRSKSTTQPDYSKLRASLAEYMERQGLRWTDKRRLICDLFFESTKHVSLEELLSEARERDRRIGYATVYRTMRMLVQSGVAHERRFGDGVTNYEPRDIETHHDHMICLDCGKIVEFKDPRIEKLQDQLARRHGFKVRHHKHELYCVCLSGNCAEKLRKKRR